MLTSQQSKNIIQYINKKKPKALMVSDDNLNSLINEAKINKIKSSDRDIAVLSNTFILNIWSHNIDNNTIIEQLFSSSMKYTLNHFLNMIQKEIKDKEFSLFDGTTCIKCQQYYPYASEDSATFQCWACRNGV